MKKIKKVKPNENTHIYYVFNTSDYQISSQNPPGNVTKSDLQINTGIESSQTSDK